MTTTQTKTSGGRTAAIFAGALLALTGTAVAAVGGILLGLFGGDGTVASGSHPLSTSRGSASRRAAPTAPRCVGRSATATTAWS
jgi:hypothetical protein